VRATSNAPLRAKPSGVRNGFEVAFERRTGRRSSSAVCVFQQQVHLKQVVGQEARIFGSLLLNCPDASAARGPRRVFEIRVLRDFTSLLLADLCPPVARAFLNEVVRKFEHVTGPTSAHIHKGQ
jgi:hypothetical protein